MDSDIKRIFIVGIARAGTTLVQSVLGAHPDILTFPESHFMDYNFSHELWKKPFTRVTERNREVTADILHSIGAPYEPGAESLDLGSNKKFSKSFFHILDTWAIQQEKKAWLEKTPIHLRFLDKIEEAAPDAKIIHVVRKPVDNIASLIRVSRKHPEHFNHSSLRAATTRYKRDIRRSLEYTGNTNHQIVSYASFCRHTEEIKKSCWEFFGLNTDFEASDHKRMGEKVSGKDESWKAKNQHEIKLQTENFEGLTDKEVRWLKSREGKLNNIFNKLEPYIIK